MARVNILPGNEGPVGRFEQQVVERIRTLPNTWTLFPNITIKQPGRDALEYDAVLLGPHAIYVLEAKEWLGRLSGDDTEWLLNRTPRACPMPTVNHKAKVLKSFLAAPRTVWIAPVLVLPNDVTVEVTGGWAENIVRLDQLLAYLQESKRVPDPTNLLTMQAQWVEHLRGNAGRRDRGARRRFGAYETTEILTILDDLTEFRAKRAVVDDPHPYRVRVWTLDPYLSDAARLKRLEVIKRPTAAVASIGAHENLLQVLHFDEIHDEHRFYEVTEWSDFGKLHTFLRNPDSEKLTLRERLEIALGVAMALEAVHAKGLVHRNLCPETILVGHDRKARLTDFDRAYMEGAGAVTVFGDVRTRNNAYLPPELENPAEYDFDTASDMYSFGVLLFELLTGRTPFASPTDARAARGRPKDLPSALRPGLEASLDELVLQLLAVDDFQSRPSATEVAAALRTILDDSRHPRSEEPRVATQPTARFEEGSVIDGVYRIEKELGGGAASKVYRIFHLEHARRYAMKVLHGHDQDESSLQELNTGIELPHHPSIARVYWQGRLLQPPRSPYVLTEFVDGETLESYCEGRKTLPLREARDVILRLLDALAAIHPPVDAINGLRAKIDRGDASASDRQQLEKLQGQGFLHRDIKPANLMLAMPERTPKIIDFNIAARYAEAKGVAGTPRYMAPDRGAPDWQPHHDLFSLGVVFYELVLHQHPYPNDTPGRGAPLHPWDLAHGKMLSHAFADFLHRAVQPDGARRFRSASEMAEALRAIEALNAPVSDDAPVTQSNTSLTLLPEEQGRSDYNPYVTRLLTLYSQARYTNSGTRGLDDIARLTYVRTRLDDRLAPEIVDGRFRLVLISGNAGDGKTAFLQQLEHAFTERGASVARLPSGNGASWTHDGLQYRSNYDGSQDEGPVRSDDVLADFLAPFAAGVDAVMAGQKVRLIAINEGRLLDFFGHSVHRGRFDALGTALIAHIHDRAPLPEGVLLVNLNHRAVAVRGTRGEPSLVDAQLGKMLDAALWEPCNRCSLQARCPLKHNADTLRDATAGKAVQERVRRLYEVVHLRRRQHITMRDLRSSLSWLLLRDHGCDDVATLLRRNDPDAAERLARLYYPDAFSADLATSTTTVEDRLVRLLRETDVGQVESPALDRALMHRPEKAVGWMTVDSRSPHGGSVIESLHQNLPHRNGELGELADTLTRNRHLAARLRRWAYFERMDDGWKAMLPYRSIDLYERVAMAADDTPEGADARDRLRTLIVEAVSLSEGVRHPQMRREHICLRVSRPKAQRATSFRLFAKHDFEVVIERSETLRRYLEMAPDQVLLQARTGHGTRAPATLRLTLDLLEMLELIRRGYRPGPSDMRGLFVNLMIFRNELLNLPFERVMVTLDQERFHEISARRTQDDVVIEVHPVATREGEVS